CAAPSAKGDDKFITTDYLQQCLFWTIHQIVAGDPDNVVLPAAEATRDQQQIFGIQQRALVLWPCHIPVA
ncbi:hypothetical protein WI728_21870, partial [Salmonella enterica subsp. enterica serovar Corvallis]